MKKIHEQFIQPKIFNNVQEKKPFVVPKYLKIIFVGIVLFVLLIILVFFLPVFKVKNIEIIGSPSEKLKNEIENFKGQNIFEFDVSSAEQVLSQNNREFTSIKIYRGIPDTLRVRFFPREPNIIWQTYDKKYLIDKDGFLFDEVINSIDLPIVYDEKNLDIAIGKQIASSNFVNFIKNVKNKLNEQGIEVKQFTISETTFQVKAQTNDCYIIFDTIRPFSDQIDAFQIVYKEHKSEITEYIDVRVEGWVYYK